MTTYEDWFARGQAAQHAVDALGAGRPLPPEPDIIDDDAQAYWFGALDVRADPTGSTNGGYPPFVQIGGEEYTPDQARALADNLRAAADYAEGK